MLGFIRHFMPYQGLPIGVDLGGQTVRMAQVESVNDELRLVHAAEMSVEEGLPQDRPSRLADAIKTGLRSGGFRGRNITVGLTAGAVHIKHLRMPRVEGPEFTALLKEQAEAALNAPASDFLIRGVVAGEVFGEQSPQQEVVLFATPQAFVQELLQTAAAARVEIVGVHVQQRIVAEYFSRLYRRKANENAVNLFVDLGHQGTRAFVAAPSDLRFVRSMPLSVSSIHEKITTAMAMSAAETRVLRKSVIAHTAASPNALPAEQPPLSPLQQKLIDITNTCAAPLATELDMCRRYYEATFSSQPVTRLIFLGGGARDQLLCSAVAQAMSLPAQIGDPLLRFNRSALPSLACVDHREAVPQWAVAFGLSLCGQTVAHV